MKTRLKKIIIRDLVFLLIIIGYYYLNKYTGFSIPCPFNYLTGYLCPGCGITRMLFSLFKLNIHEAFTYNQLVFIYLPFIVAYFIYYDYLFVYDKKDKIICKIPKIVWYILIAITISFGIVRNII